MRSDPLNDEQLGLVCDKGHHAISISLYIEDGASVTQKTYCRKTLSYVVRGAPRNRGYVRDPSGYPFAGVAMLFAKPRQSFSSQDQHEPAALYA